ncbi:Putative Condensin complex subunit 2 [Rhizopus microsporus]|nr:Putative Condensin complex subunit 2 [Rhizopus microsporus]
MSHRSNKRHINMPSTSSHGATNSTLQPSVPALTPAQMYSNFEEWIKLCTDNKVNASNTWTFALIDYFHEMTFLRDGDTINFQKASCTLDGCVKIYTSRVDSVATETGKLLSGLADSSHDNEDEERKERKVRRKTQKSDASLVKDFSSISLKKFDLDFAVDPLFKKTSADFDEGGARGLLLNHLGIDRHCKIIFDASDSTVDCDTEDEEEEEEEKEEEKEDEIDDPMDEDNEDKEDDSVDNSAENNPKDNSSNTENNSSEIKVQLPDGSHMTEISRLKCKLPSLELLEELHIVPSLKGFDFFNDDLEIPELHSDTEDPFEDQQPEEGNDFLNFNDYDIDYNNNDDMDPFLLSTGLEDDNIENDDPELDEGERGFPEKDYLSALLNNENQDLFNYFDNTLVKNWAGPEHWKLRKAPATTTTTTNEKRVITDIQGEGGEDRPKKKRQEQLIDFTASDEDEDEDIIFEQTNKKLTLPTSMMNNPSKHLLPDDIHFSSKQLLQYFLKPMFPINANKKKNIDVAVPQKTSEEPDANFWAEQMQSFEDYDVEYDNDVPADMTDNPEPTILSAIEDSSFFYQDDYLPDSQYEDTPEIYGDTLIANHIRKTAKPLYVNYARQAKRVDVKKLKDNLWMALTNHTERVNGTQKFTDVVNDLKKMYSPKVMKDISVPFCFICLLHLANEKDLVIMGHNQDDDFVLGDDILNEVTICQSAVSHE